MDQIPAVICFEFAAEPRLLDKLTATGAGEEDLEEETAE